jgi:outer membrane protein insertion porin family/translocation and assembly module TamA
MSDVAPSPSDIRLTHLHLSSGVGARYDTPVGPIRLDIGYRIQPLQVLGFRNEDDVGRQDPVEGVPPKLFGVPIAIAFGIGEAY